MIITLLFVLMTLVTLWFIYNNEDDDLTPAERFVAMDFEPIVPSYEEVLMYIDLLSEDHIQFRLQINSFSEDNLLSEATIIFESEYGDISENLPLTIHYYEEGELWLISGTLPLGYVGGVPNMIINSKGAIPVMN